MLRLLPRVFRTRAHRELMAVLVWREVVARYKRTTLGVAWALAEPLTLGLVYFVVFRYFAQIQVDNYALYVLSGILPWTFLQGALSHCAGALNENANLIKKVYFPREALAWGKVLNQLLNLSIGIFLLVVARAAWPGGGLTLELAWLVPGLLLVLLLAVTVGFLVAVASPYMMDLPYLLTFAFRLGTYATPIIYQTRNVPQAFQWVLWLNPMTVVVELFHAALVPQHELDAGVVLPSLGVLLGVSLVAWALFRKVELRVAEVL